MWTLRILVIASLLSVSCHIPPTVTWGPIGNAEGPTIGFFSNRQRDRVERSLQDAGFEIVSTNTSYFLEVAIGAPRWPYSCGTNNNVRYTLMRGGNRMLVMKGRGNTGDCEPNILDGMSRDLASFFTPARDPL